MKNTVHIQEKSFTLIELLVAIAIIGLISSIVLVNLGNPKEKTRIAKSLEFGQTVLNTLGAESIGIWNFDEGSGTVAKDASGHGNNGTFEGNVSFSDDTPYKIVGPYDGKYALSFDGSDAVNIAKIPNTSSDITLEAWFKTSSTYGGTILSLGDSSYPGMGVSGNYARANNDKNAIAVAGAKKVQVDKWYHLIAVIGTSGIKLYIDSQLDGQISTSFSAVDNTRARIGWGTGYHWGDFRGLIDEVKIYNYALTIGQIQEHYAEGLERHQNLVVK